MHHRWAVWCVWGLWALGSMRMERQKMSRELALRMVLPSDLHAALERAPEVVIPDSREEMLELAMGG